MNLEIKYLKEPDLDNFIVTLAMSILIVLCIMALFNHFGGYWFFIIFGYMMYVVVLARICRIKIRKIKDVK